MRSRGMERVLYGQSDALGGGTGAMMLVVLMMARGGCADMT